MTSAISSLIQREFLRFIRQKGRVIATMVTPLGFWLFLGSGIARSFGSLGNKFATGSLEFFFPGMLLMVVLFASVFSMISLIEDRDEGFLQSVLVSPVSNVTIVMSKVGACTLFAMLQAFPFFLLSIFLGYWSGPWPWLSSFVVLILVSILMASLSFVLAWLSQSVGEFHSWMNTLLFPMWMISGALFPVSESLGWIRALAYVNPLFYAHQALLRFQGFETADFPAEVILCLSAFVFVLLSLLFLKRKRAS
ncbi:MAG: ABC transporter permease [Bdellovibrionota bacterium]